MPKRAICQYWNWHSHFQYWHPFPVLSFFEFHFRKISIWYSTQSRNLPVLELSVTHSSHFRYWALPVPVRYSIGPVPELDSMRAVPFPVWGSASSGMVIHWAPYRNWTLCACSHFRYRALPVQVRSYTGPRTETGLYAHGPISGTGLCQFRYGHSLGPVPKLDSMHVVPFPVLGSAIQGRSFTGPRTKTGLYARWVHCWWVCGSMTMA